MKALEFILIVTLACSATPSSALVSEDGSFERLDRVTQDDLERAFVYVLFDSASARIKVVRKQPGVYCGLINGKNKFGAYVGYKPYAISTEPPWLWILPEDIKNMSEDEIKQTKADMERAKSLCSP